MATLLAAFGSAGAARLAGQRELEALPGISRAAATAIRAASPDRATRLLSELRETGGTAFGPADREYPARLREIPEAPTLLFARGDPALLHKPAVAVVGSRDHTAYGERVARDLAARVAAAGVPVVSGMARGLDGVAHAAALDAGGGTIGVLGNGLGVVYPAANRALYERVEQQGCLLTEFPPGERPHAGSFPRRNRLISGLAVATVVVEARVGSGALITADCALRQGREVLAVPGPITSPTSAGPNRLVALGAKPVLDVRDVLEEVGVAEPPGVRIPRDLTPAERCVMEHVLDGSREGKLDDLLAEGLFPSHELLAAITSLEIRGLIVPVAGRGYRPAVQSSAAGG